MRRRRIRVQPSKSAATLSFVMGIIFCFIGFIIIIPTFGPFGLLWTGIAVAITVSNFRAMKGQDSAAGRDIIIEDDDYGVLEEMGLQEARPAPSDAEQRLTELQNLYHKGLITRDEYDEKRAKVLEEL